MAIKLGMARNSYQAIESGQNKMNINDFFKIIEILQIPINIFNNQDLTEISKEDINKLINNINELYNLSKKYIHD